MQDLFHQEYIANESAEIVDLGWASKHSRGFYLGLLPEVAWAEAWWWWWSTVGFLEGIRESSTKMEKPFRFKGILVMCPRNILLMLQKSCTTLDLQYPINDGIDNWLVQDFFPSTVPWLSRLPGWQSPRGWHYTVRVRGFLYKLQTFICRYFWEGGQPKTYLLWTSWELTNYLFAATVCHQEGPWYQVHMFPSQNTKTVDDKGWESTVKGRPTPRPKKTIVILFWKWRKFLERFHHFWISIHSWKICEYYFGKLNSSLENQWWEDGISFWNIGPFLGFILICRGNIHPRNLT